MKKNQDVSFEESIFEGWSGNARLEVPIARTVFLLLGIVGFLIAGIVVTRVVFLVGLAGPGYTARALSNVDKEFILPAYRGIITDRFGEQLVKNIPSFRVSIDRFELLRRGDLEAQGELLRMVASTLGIREEDIRSALQGVDLEKASRVVIARDVSGETAIDLRALQNDALIIEDDYRRQYIDPFIFSHVLGYTGSIDFSPTIEGKDGLEAVYDSVLRGVDGLHVVYRDVKGTVLQEKRVREAESGLPIKSTIDAEFQRYFYKRFEEGLAGLGKTSGVGVALNPQTGEVLAMVNFPSFDNNNPADYLNSPGKPLFNRAVSGVYSPGSTIKPLVALAALHEQVVTPSFTVYSPGYLELPNPYNPDQPSRFLDWRPQGTVDLYSAIARSSNVYFYVVGGGCTASTCNDVGRNKGLGIYKLNEYWKKFGLDAITDIDLPGEAVGFLPNPEEKKERTGQPWRIGDTYNVAIGQGDLGVTPIRLLTFFSSIANKGVMMKPRLLLDEPSSVLLDYSVWTDEIVAVRQGVRDAVGKNYGTASLLYDLSYKTSGKTGSAQIANNAKTNAFFMGYGPSDDPKIAILVLVEDAKTGSLNAVPIAKDVMEWYYVNRL